MRDGTTTIDYLVELVYTADATAYRQGVVLLETSHLEVAKDAAASSAMLRRAKAIKLAESSASKLTGPAKAYSLRIRKRTTSRSTEIEWVD